MTKIVVVAAITTVAFYNERIVSSGTAVVAIAKDKGFGIFVVDTVAKSIQRPSELDIVDNIENFKSGYLR